MLFKINVKAILCKANGNVILRSTILSSKIMLVGFIQAGNSTNISMSNHNKIMNINSNVILIGGEGFNHFLFQFFF